MVAVPGAASRRARTDEGEFPMSYRPFRPRWYIAALTTGVVAFATAAGPATAQVPEPSGQLRSTVTHNQWKIQLYTGDAGTEIAVRHDQGGLETVLRPSADLNCPTGAIIGCRPAIDLPRPDRLRGKGIVVHADTPDPFHPPEISTVMFTGEGAHCCFTAIGYSRGQDGPWDKRTVNSGSTGITTDGKGRIQVGDPRWETLDWPYAASRPYLTWRTLTPTSGGAKWKDTTTKADHRKRLRAASTALRKLQRSKGRQQREQQRSTRAVIAAHRKALGQSKQVRRDRQGYRKLYGAASLKRLDRGLKRVVRARS